MGLKKLILGDPELKGMQYRLRVFDHGHHIKTATVVNRGQRRIDLIVKEKQFGFIGEEVKLAFMINPKIPPHYFGNIMEIDFDVRDATQLADLFDLCPDLVYEINENLYKTMSALTRSNDNVIEAEFKEKTEMETKKEAERNGTESLNALTDPITPEEPETPNLEKIPPIEKIKNAVQSSAHSTVITIQGLKYLNDIRIAEEEQKQELVRKTLDFCSQPGNQKCLRWLPARLHIEPEILSVISQIELDGVGIDPMYYIKQSAAEISEKMLQRPKIPDDWKTTMIYVIGLIAVFGLVVVLLLKMSGKI